MIYSVTKPGYEEESTMLAGTEITHRCQHLVILLPVASWYSIIRVKNGKPVWKDENGWMWPYKIREILKGTIMLEL